MKEFPEKTLITLILGIIWLISIAIILLSSNQSELPDLIQNQGIIVGDSLITITSIIVYFLIFRVFTKLDRENQLKQEWRLLLGKSRDLTYIIDSEGKILEIEESGENILGYQRETLINQEIFNFIDPADLDRVKTTFQELNKQDSTTIEIEFSLLNQEQNYHNFHWIISNFLTEKSEIKIILTGKDQTEIESLKTANQRLRKSLKESETRYQILTDNIPIMIWICDLDQKYTFFNLAWRDFMGKIIDQEIDQHWRDRIHPEDQENCYHNYNLSWENQDNFTQQYRLKRIDGQYRWILEKAVPLFNSEHNFIGYLGTCLDITESKNLEEKLNKQITRYQQAIQNSDSFIFSQNVNLQYTFLENFVNNNQDNLGKSDFDLFPQQEAKQLVDLKYDVLKTESGIHQEIVFSTPENPQYWDFNIQPLKNDQGLVIGVTGLFYNVSKYRLEQIELQSAIETKETEIKQLTQGYHFLENILDNLPAIIYLYDTIKEDLTYLHYTDQILGNLPDHSLADLTEIIHPEDRETWLNFTARSEQFEAEKIINFTFRLQDQEGNYYTFQTWEIKPENNQSILGIGVKFNPPPEIIIEEKEIETKENSIPNLVLSPIIEQLTKPLSAILISVQILTNSDDQWLNEKVIRNLSRIEHSVQLILHLLESLELFEQYHQGLLELNNQSFELRNFCKHLITEVRKQTDYPGKISLIGNDQEIMVTWDQKFLKQILGNLLINAVEYSPENGEISLGIFVLENEIILTIRDRGLGIANQDLRTIFNPFYRGNNADQIPGLGLGLTLVKQLISLMGGKIIVESHLGFGTTFNLQIPRF
jgi:PAS domain S-box-containing protein